jgi:CheY-like chemotaxis protein
VANVFISYQRSDTLLLAHCLRYALGAAGHQPFVDTGTIPAGTAFAPFIDEWLARADLVLILLGPAFDYSRLQQTNSAVAFEWRRARFHGCAILPVLYRQHGMVSADQLPGELRWLPALNARLVSDLSLSADVDALVNAIPAVAHRPRPSARVLWIDDNPKNNVIERRYLRHWGISFDNVVSTQEAVEQLRNSSYDLVITDLSQYTVDERSSLAGFNALQSVLTAAGPPVIVYAGNNAMRLRDEVVRRGGIGSTKYREELYALIEKALGRTMPSDSALER